MGVRPRIERRTDISVLQAVFHGAANRVQPAVKVMALAMESCQAPRVIQRIL